MRISNKSLSHHLWLKSDRGCNGKCHFFSPWGTRSERSADVSCNIIMQSLEDIFNENA